MINNKIISCVVLNYNDYKTTLDFLRNHILFNSIDYFVVVDNHSTDNSYEVLKNEFIDNGRIIVIESDKNGGYGYGNNVGIRFAINSLLSEYIIISNPDVLFKESTIFSLAEALDKNENSFIATAKMLNRDGLTHGTLPWRIPSKKEYIFLDSIIFGRQSFRFKEADFLEDVQSVDCVSGAFLMLKKNKDCIDGLYDENIFLYCEETSIGIKYKELGYRTLFLTNETFVHLGSHSIDKTFKTSLSKLKLTLKSRYYVLSKYYKVSFFSKGIIKFLFLLQKIELILYNFFRRKK